MQELPTAAKEHIADGHIRIKKYKGEIIVEEYEYIAKHGGREAQSGFNYSANPSGFHILSNLDNKSVKIFENITTKKIPTGETVRLAKIEYWIKETGLWKLKRDTHTFFPSQWDINKVKSIVQEAVKNAKLITGNKYHGITNSGIKIEFYINESTREINTAYIIF